MAEHSSMPDTDKLFLKNDELKTNQNRKPTTQISWVFWLPKCGSSTGTEATLPDTATHDISHAHSSVGAV